MRLPRDHPVAGSIEAMSGKLIALEGLDGAGKSTLADGLESHFSASFPVVRYVEPGGTPVGEEIRRLLKDKDLPIGARAEALLFAAARAELSDLIARDLEQGRLVIVDRWLYSSVAYQGQARGLGEEWVLELNLWAADRLMPDAWIYLDLSLEQAELRRQQRGIEVDRIEAEDRDFFRLVSDAYLRLAKSDPRALILPASLPSRELQQLAVKELSSLGI